jgi:hypothetical protein
MDEGRRRRRESVGGAARARDQAIWMLGAVRPFLHCYFLECYR